MHFIVKTSNHQAWHFVLQTRTKTNIANKQIPYSSGTEGRKRSLNQNNATEYPVTESIAIKEAIYCKTSMFVIKWNRQDHHKNWNKKQLNPLLTYNAPLGIF